MRKILFSILILLVFLITLNNNNLVYAEQINVKKYKTVPVYDAKTRAELARTIIPEDFVCQSSVQWARDFENPVYYNVLAKNSDGSQLSFFSKVLNSDVLNDAYADLHENKYDSIFKIFRKKSVTPDDFIYDFLKKDNQGIMNFKLVKKSLFSDSLIDYLENELNSKNLIKLDNYKTDKRFSNLKIVSQKVEPIADIYSFLLNGVEYKQCVITLLFYTDFEITKKTSYDKFETQMIRLWGNSGLFSIKAKADDFDKYFDDFIVFVINTIPGQSAEYAVQRTAYQMKVELNPDFTDIHTGSPLKNLPSDLFMRYYYNAKPDYSLNAPLLMPCCDNSRWIISLFDKPVTYSYRQFNRLNSQVISAPSAFPYVYFNKAKGILILSTEKKDNGFGFKKLKKSKESNIVKD